jgi:general nucleoside transport system ATP-binding protein
MKAVEMRNVTKTFGLLTANDHVNFSLEEGEIHALLGENGAGKTTLMRVLYGLYQPDQGEIFVHGEKVEIASPGDAINNGIGMVTQNFTLVPTLSVTENLLLSEKRGVLLDLNNGKKRILAAAEKFGIPINPDILVKHLSVGEKQRVEIIKALFRNARILIMDEPTAVLIPQEIDQLMVTLENLRKQGFSIIFISHKLNEVMAICGRISVLRDGHMIGTVNKLEINQKKLAEMMVGRETSTVSRDYFKEESSKPILLVEKLSAKNRKGMRILKDVSFTVHQGEILGVAGISGNGQSELAQVLSGVLKSTAGSIVFDGKEISKSTPKEIIEVGVGRIPEDRNASVVGEMTVAENLVMEHVEEYTKNGLLDKKRINYYAEKLIQEFNIKAKPDDRVRTLSGGNMQKALLTRVLSRNPELIIVSQPTRGLDVGATEYIRLKLIEQAKKGAAVLLFSEDLDEIFTLSDRIAVIYEGKIMDIIPSKQATIEQVGLLMAGVRN